jgi:hypothetical protein
MKTRTEEDPMANNSELKVLITGDASSAMGALQGLTKSVKGAADQIEGHFNGIARVVDNLAAPIMKLTALFGGGALFRGAVDGAVEMGKETGKLQRVMGGTSRDASILAVAIGDIYGDTDGFLAGAAKVTRTLNTNEQAIKDLGVTTRLSNGAWKSTPVLISEINAKLAEYTEGTARNVAAQKIYGKSYQEMLRYIAMTPEILEEARRKVDELGLALDGEGKAKIKAYRAAMNDVHDVFQAVRLRVGLEVMPSLTALGNWFTSVAPGGINLTIHALRTLGEVLSMTTVKVGLLALAVQGLGGATVIRGLGNLAAALREVVSASWYNTEGPLSALGSRLATFAGSGGLVITALAGVALGLEWLDKSGKRAHERAMEGISDASRQISSLQGLQKEYAEIAKRLDSGKLSGEAKAKALKDLKSIQDQIIAIAPEYKSALDAEKDGYVAAAKALKELNEQKKRGLEANLAKMEADLKAAEEREARLSEQPKGYNKSAGEGDTGAVIVEVDSLRKASERVTQLRAQVQKLKAEIGQLNSGDKKESGNNAGGGGGTATERQNTFEQDMNRLKKEGLQYEEQTTLEQRKQVELKRLEGQRDEELLATKTKLKNGQLTEDQANKERAAINENFRKGELALEAKYNTERQKIDQDTQNKLETLEELGYARKAAAMRQAFDKANEERRKAGLQEISDEGLKQRLLALKAREIESEVGKLRSGLQDLEREKGRALTFDEQIKSLDGLAKKLGIELPEAIKRLIEELQNLKDRQNDAGGGFRAGIDEYLRNSQDRFKRMKDMALSMAQGSDNALSGFLQSMTQHGTTAAQKWDALWKNLSQSTVKALSDMAAQEITSWGIKKLVFAWDQLAAGWRKKDTNEKISEDGKKQTSGIGLAAVNTEAQMSSTGPYGWLAGFAAVAAVLALLSSITAHAVGGIIDRPTLALMGEAGTELVAPETSFRQWAAQLSGAHLNLGYNLARHEAQIAGYQAQARDYGARAVQMRESGDPPERVSFPNATIFTTGSREMRDFIREASRGYDRSI